MTNQYNPQTKRSQQRCLYLVDDEIFMDDEIFKMWKLQDKKFELNMGKNPLYFVENPQDKVDREKNFDKASKMLVDHFERIVQIPEQDWPYLKEVVEEKEVTMEMELDPDEPSTDEEGTESSPNLNPPTSNEVDSKDRIASDFNGNEKEKDASIAEGIHSLMDVVNTLSRLQNLKRRVAELAKGIMQDSEDRDSLALLLEKKIKEVKEINELMHIVEMIFINWFQTKEKENGENEIKSALDEKSDYDIPNVAFTDNIDQINDWVKAVHDHLHNNTGKFLLLFSLKKIFLFVISKNNISTTWIK